MGYKLKWTIEKCVEEGLKYTSTLDFRNFSSSSYETCRKNHWLDLVCGHMATKIKPVNYWTKEACQNEA